MLPACPADKCGSSTSRPPHSRTGMESGKKGTPKCNEHPGETELQTSCPAIPTIPEMSGGQNPVAVCLFMARAIPVSDRPARHGTRFAQSGLTLSFTGSRVAPSNRAIASGTMTAPLSASVMTIRIVTHVPTRPYRIALTTRRGANRFFLTCLLFETLLATGSIRKQTVLLSR